MKKKITGNFEIDKCYCKYNSPFIAEKRVKWFKTLTVYLTSIRDALKIKNDKYFICLFIFNNK